MKARSAQRAAVVLVGLVAGLGLGCARSDEQASVEKQAAIEKRVPSREALAEPRQPGSPPGTPAPLAPGTPAPLARAAWLEGVQRVHGLADSARSNDERRRAIAQIAEVFAEEAPLAPAAVAPVKQDLASRAARLALELGTSSEAQAWAERGLALGDGLPVFRANLLVDLADAERALGQSEAARDHLVQALGINQDLLDRELEAP